MRKKMLKILTYIMKYEKNIIINIIYNFCCICAHFYIEIDF